MISLSNVEAQVAANINNRDSELLAVNLPDDKKGEKIILLCTAELDSETIQKELLSKQCNPLTIPSHFLTIKAIPKLGTGKTDINAAKELALQWLNGNH